MRLNGLRRALSGGVKRFALLLAASLVPLQCATLERLNLDDMIAKSTAIVRGKVMDSWAAFTGPIIYTHYRIQVSERFSGPNQGSVELLVPGGMVSNLRQSFAGAPEFNQGDEFVFFLWTSKAGLTQVIGLTQGLFALPRDGSADPVATRAASHELMLDPGTGHPVKDQALVMRLSELRSRIASTLAASRSGAK